LPLLECWDRVRFHSAEKAEKNLKTVSEGLEVIEKIRRNLEKRSIDETEAEKLKRDVLKSVHDLFSNGVYTPEMELIVVPKPCELPIERRKMISFVHNSDDPDLYSVGDQGPSAQGDFSGTGVERHPNARKRAGTRKQLRKNAKSLRK
jgi:hypothetical protein